jgi:superfamily II DNA/RNA helicase
VFTNKIALANPIQNALRQCGISAGQLHGKQTQDIREDVVKRFRTGEYEMLIASNVASRGLDFPDIRLVVQFELPKTVEIYTHRIGRTGRNGQTGTALSYFSSPDKKIAAKLLEFMQLNEQAAPRWLDEIVNPGIADDRDRDRDRDRRGDRDRDRRRSRSRSYRGRR